MNKFLSLLSLAVVVVFSACQKESNENAVVPAKEETTRTPKAVAGRLSATAATTDLFVLAENYIYRVNAITKQATIVGTGWAGTEAMTVNPHTNSIYAVQGDHLWKFNLSNQSVQDYGAGWGGTEAITNNGDAVNRLSGDIFAVQGGSLWKVLSTIVTQAQRVGTGDWSGTVDMSAVLSQRNLQSIQGNAMWATRPYDSRSPSTQINTHLDLTNVVAYVHTGWDYFYVRGGRLWKNGNILGDIDWTGTQAITYAGNSIWIVRNSLVYQVDYYTGGINGYVPGILNSYGVESYEGK